MPSKFNFVRDHACLVQYEIAVSIIIITRWISLSWKFIWFILYLKNVWVWTTESSIVEILVQTRVSISIRFRRNYLARVDPLAAIPSEWFLLFPVLSKTHIVFAHGETPAVPVHTAPLIIRQNVCRSRIYNETRPGPSCASLHPINQSQMRPRGLMVSQFGWTRFRLVISSHPSAFLPLRVTLYVIYIIFFIIQIIYNIDFIQIINYL